MNKRQATRIATNTFPNSPYRKVVFVSVWKGGYLYCYATKNPTGGHKGRALYALVMPNGSCNILDDDDDVADAVTFHASLLCKKQ